MDGEGGKKMLILDMSMPRACDDCPMLDESGDYPMCRISGETRGYTFHTREKRMDRCPIKGELARCWECKHRGNDFECPLAPIGLGVPDDFFCADVERKDDGDC